MRIKFGHLPFLGIYSRGKSHILRLAVPIQLLLTEFDTDNDEVCIPPCMLTPNCVNYINLRVIPISSLLYDKVLSECMLLTHLSKYCCTTKNQYTINFNFQTKILGSPLFSRHLITPCYPVLGFWILNFGVLLLDYRWWWLCTMWWINWRINWLRRQQHGKLIKCLVEIALQYYAQRWLLKLFLHNVILK